MSSDVLKLLIEREDGEQNLGTFSMKWSGFPDSKTLFYVNRFSTEFSKFDWLG